MRHRLRERGLADRVVVESAGTSDWHVGDAADRRAAEEARGRGITMDGCARQFTPADFARYDLVLAMDHSNRADLLAIAPGEEAAARVRLLREFDPAAADAGDLAVPDPYFGGPDGFVHVFDLVDAACQGLIDHLEARLSRSG